MRRDGHADGLLAAAYEGLRQQAAGPGDGGALPGADRVAHAPGAQPSVGDFLRDEPQRHRLLRRPEPAEDRRPLSDPGGRFVQKRLVGAQPQAGAHHRGHREGTRSHAAGVPSPVRQPRRHAHGQLLPELGAGAGAQRLGRTLGDAGGEAAVLHRVGPAAHLQLVELSRAAIHLALRGLSKPVGGGIRGPVLGRRRLPRRCGGGAGARPRGGVVGAREAVCVERAEPAAAQPGAELLSGAGAFRGRQLALAPDLGRLGHAAVGPGRFLGADRAHAGRDGLCRCVQEPEAAGHRARPAPARQAVHRGPGRSGGLPAHRDGSGDVALEPARLRLYRRAGGRHHREGPPVRAGRDGEEEPGAAQRPAPRADGEMDLATPAEGSAAERAARQQRGGGRRQNAGAGRGRAAEAGGRRGGFPADGDLRFRRWRDAVGRVAAACRGATAGRRRKAAGAPLRPARLDDGTV